MWFVVYHFYGDCWLFQKLCLSLGEAEDYKKKMMRSIIELDASWNDEELEKNFCIKVVSELPVPVSLADM